MNVLQLQMVFTEGYTQLQTCHYTTVNISYEKSDLRIAYLPELFSLYPCDEAAGPQKSGILLFVLVHQR